MITGDQIRDLIANPYAIEGDQLDSIKSLVDQHEYCSSLHILLLKGMADCSDLNFEKQLKIAAAHVPDREHLYRLIHSELQSDDIQEKATTDPVKETTASVENIAEGAPIPESVDEEEKSPVEDVAETPSSVGVSITEEPETVVDEESFTDEQEESSPSPVHSELESTILTEALDQHYIDSVDDENEPPETVIPPAEVINATTTDNEAVEFQPEEEPEEDSSIEKITASADNSSQEPLSFIDWLKQKQLGIEHPEEPLVKEKEKIDPSDSSHSSAAKTDQKKSKTDSLLEKFIAEEPTISRPVKDFYNPAKTAKKSLEESDDLVSETLAKIHLMQKNYRKAISTYEKLILLYPEKKAFFADQIKKIEDEIKK